MERETRKFTTPVGKVEITLNAWLTGGEKMTLMKTTEGDMMEFMLETIVASPSLNEVKALHGKDFDVLLKEMNGVAENSAWSEEKKA